MLKKVLKVLFLTVIASTLAVVHVKAEYTQQGELAFCGEAVLALIIVMLGLLFIGTWVKEIFETVERADNADENNT